MNENLLSYFKLYCVDDKLDHLPIHIQVVPTMIVSGVNRPLIAREAFEWVQKAKFIKQQALNNQQKLIQHNINKMLNKGPIGFNDQEMSGTSDNYAYKDVDRAFTHSYFGVNDEKNNAIFTAPTNKEVIGKNDQLNLIKALEQKRNDQDNKFKNIHKQQKLMKILKSEQSNNKGSRY
jgi:hypothetical protein